MLCNTSENFNYGYNPFNNKYLMGYKDLFRGAIVKEQVVSNKKQIDFKSHNKAIVKMCIVHFMSVGREDV